MSDTSPAVTPIFDQLLEEFRKRGDGVDRPVQDAAPGSNPAESDASSD
jgi:hypothetical protein